MTPNDRNIVKALIAVAWADGKMEEAETGVIEGLLAGFDASDEEERDLLAWARTRRTLADIPVSEMTRDDRELLLGNAALLTHADGEQSTEETKLIADLSRLLEFSDEEAFPIIESVRGGKLSQGLRASRDAAVTIGALWDAFPARACGPGAFQEKSVVSGGEHLVLLCTSASRCASGRPRMRRPTPETRSRRRARSRAGDRCSLLRVALRHPRGERLAPRRVQGRRRMGGEGGQVPRRVVRPRT
jgi:tellurite resistance protein